MDFFYTADLIFVFHQQEYREELEWLSNFVEESFSSEEIIQKNDMFSSPISFTGKARSKRARVIGPKSVHGGERKKCLHCSTEKTPQWRTGPDGPKTLCNACGVRFKSGRLVPEYRPAASPTFVPSQHSNSHRKVLQLRRQKEVEAPRPEESQPAAKVLQNCGRQQKSSSAADFRRLI